jgi:hypothetical protein
VSDGNVAWLKSVLRAGTASFGFNKDVVVQGAVRAGSGATLCTVPALAPPK